MLSCGHEAAAAKVWQFDNENSQKENHNRIQEGRMYRKISVHIHGVPTSLEPGIYGSNYLMDGNTIHVHFVPGKSPLDSVIPITVGLPKPEKILL